MKILIEDYNLLLESFYTSFILTDRSKDTIKRFMDSVDDFLRSKKEQPINNRIDPDSFHISFMASNEDEPDNYRKTMGKTREVQSVLNTPLKRKNVIPLKLDSEFPLSFTFGDYMVLKIDKSSNSYLTKIYNDALNLFGTEIPPKHKTFRPHISLAVNTKQANNFHVAKYKKEINKILKRHIDQVFIYNNEVIDDRPEDQRTKTKDMILKKTVKEEGEGVTNTTSNIATYTAPISSIPLLRRKPKTNKRYFITYKYQK